VWQHDDKPETEQQAKSEENNLMDAICGLELLIKVLVADGVNDYR
jgi:hypothetical protein